jgi:hypothetical protein
MSAPSLQSMKFNCASVHVQKKLRANQKFLILLRRDRVRDRRFPLQFVALEGSLVDKRCEKSRLIDITIFEIPEFVSRFDFLSSTDSPTPTFESLKAVHISTDYTYPDSAVRLPSSLRLSNAPTFVPLHSRNSPECRRTVPGAVLPYR